MKRQGPSPAQWTIAITIAATAHLVLAAALLWETEKPGAVAAGLGGIEVSLGPEGGAPGAASEAPQEAPEAITPTANTAEATPDPLPVETLAMAEPMPEPPPVPPEPVIEETPPEPVPEPVAVPEPEPEPEPVIEEEIAIVEPPPPEPKPEPPPVPKVVMPPAPDRPVPPKRKPVEVVQPKPQPRPQPKPAPQIAEARPLPPGPAEQVVKAAPPPGSGGVGGTSKRAEVGSAASVSGGGLPGAAADYVSLLRAWLEKHKDYPRRARSRGQEGTALLYFVMDRNGRVLEYDLRSSSGYRILDDEVRKMIERAQPLPVPPVELLQNDRREFLLPVEFGLR